jgi:glycine dehydrogenase
VAAGEYDAQDNPLRNAPHTAAMLLATDWKHPYERGQAAFPVLANTGLANTRAGDKRAKYWPPVRRIDQAYGDRNLVCACPPPEAFED